MRIAVTGIGVSTAAGAGAQPIVGLLARGAHTFRPVERYDPTGLSNARIASIPGADPGALLDDVVSTALRASGRTSAPVVVGTSSGDVPDGPRDGPARRLGVRHATVSVACASGTAALAVAAGWLDDGAEVVVAAGVDRLSRFVHAGFSGLGALSAGIPRPFHADRDGLLLGEGAGALVLEPYEAAVRRGAPILAELAGVGLSCDARHRTAPDRDGRGVADAVRAALREAGLAATDLISVHGTGTPYNDAMEAHALRAVFGDQPRHVYGIKGAVGHLLGAAGAVEAAVAVHLLATGEWPAPIRDVDPALPWAARARPGAAPTSALVTSSAFGGINAAAVFVRGGAARPPVDRAVDLGPIHEVALAPGERLSARWPDAPDRAVRLDRYAQVGVWAIGLALADLPRSGPIGVVLVTETGCREADEAHRARLAAEGAARVSRLGFAATVPSAPAAEAAVIYDLRGPLLTFVGSDDPVDEAARLVRRGRADALVAVWCEAPGPDRAAVARARRVSVRRGAP